MTRFTSSTASRLVRALVALATAVLVLLTFAACGPQPGTQTISFLRGGALWTVNPDGTNAREIANGTIVSSAWSPDHHQIVYRTPLQAPGAPRMLSVRAAPADAPGKLTVVGINGGSGVQITPNAPQLLQSDAWWNASGTRLLYRQENSSGNTAGDPFYVVSQADQPLGIARKQVYDAATLPVLSPDGTRLAVISPDGAVRVGAEGVTGTAIANGALTALPGTTRPVHLLWQPKHDALLYPTASGTANGAGIALVLQPLHGTPATLATVPTLEDAAFSPDGAYLLIRTPDAFAVYRADAGAALLMRWSETDPNALPVWSPDSTRVLVADQQGLLIASIPALTTTRVLAVSTARAAVPAAPLPTATRWQPATMNPWSPDGTQIAFVAATGDRWHGASIPPPGAGTTALYVGAIARAGTAGAITRIDDHADAAPAWSYLDPSTTFLRPA